MKKGGLRTTTLSNDFFTIIIGPSKSALVYALHSLENFLGLARFRVFVLKLLLLHSKFQKNPLMLRLSIEKIAKIITENLKKSYNGHAEYLLTLFSSIVCVAYKSSRPIVLDMSNMNSKYSVKK